jgi:DNA-binding response OmpR family regulator
MKKILVVEDDEKIRRLLVDELKKQGFATIEAGNGKEGLDVALKDKPDLILLDITMPVMDGLTMLNKLRAEPAGKKVQVIILTNSGDFGKIADTVEKGICSYLVKSDITIEDLVGRVKKFLE